MIKITIQAVLISVATATIFFAVLIVLALFAPQDQQTIRRHLADAIVGGEMVAQSDLGPRGISPVYRNVFDCMLLGMMLAPAENGSAAAMSNRRAAATAPLQDARVPPFPDCQALVQAFPELGGNGVQFIPYDRYVLGMRVVGRILLSAMSVETMRRVLPATAYALLAIIALAALYRFWRANGDATERIRLAGYIAMVACLALFYCVHYFDATLTFGPMDCVQYLFILISLICPLAEMRSGRLAFYGASYGSLIAIFEILTGGITLALALLPLLLALGYRGDHSDRGDRANYLARLITLWGCFCVAVVATFALKKLYAIVLLGDTDNFIAALLHRTYGEFEGDASVSYSFASLLTAYYRGSALIGWGSSRFGALLVAASLATIALVWWRARGSLSAHLRLAGALSLAALAAWVVVFLNHSILHAFFMARFLVIPLIVAAVLTATALMARREGSQTSMTSTR